MEPIVDVIVPVYRGVAATRRCLDSVLRYPQATAFQLIVIDDATPEPDLRAYLDELAADTRLELIRNPENLGFARVANQGFRLHPDRDVLLLNSDTEVANDWLDRLRACAATDYTIATVTPFSNNATVCSYPRIGMSNALPADVGTEELDALFRQANGGAVIDLPIGVGFCMYVPRLAIDAMGGFDEWTFGDGYGEEVDFCMRARIAGWRNVLCADCFVFHEGAASFGATSEPKKQKAQRNIDRRFPDYPELVAGFFERDPPRPLRRAVDMARLAASHKPRILFVSHAWGGGVQRHIQDLADALQGRAEILLLQPSRAQTASLRWLGADEEFALHLPIGDAPDAWLAVLGALGLARVHYHHVQGFPEWILDLAAGLGLPYDVTLHDYFPVCPQLHFVDSAGQYCREPGPSVCARCIAGRPPQWPLGIEAWRHRCLTWLRSADRVIAPSADVAARMRRYDPALALVTWPHPEPSGETALPLAAQSLRRRKIAILGTLSDAKGLQRVSAAAEHAAAQTWPVDFRVIGALERPIATWPAANVSATGEYKESALETMLEQERPDAFLFASIIPETYSYTLSLALRTGLPVMALDIGAIGERLRGNSQAVLLPADVGGAEVAERALELPAAYPEPAAAAVATVATGSAPGAYIARYLKGVKPAAVLAQAPNFEPAMFYPPRQSAAAPSIDELYEQGVLCGKAEARAQLEREVGEVASRLASLQETLVVRERELAERSRALNVRERQVQELERQTAELKTTLSNFERGHRLHVEHLEGKTVGLERRIVELEGSTFWRMTLPLRWSVHIARQAVLGLRAAPAQVPRALASAQRIRGEQGWSGVYLQGRRRVQQLVVGFRQMASASVAYRPESAIQPLILPVSADPLVTVLIPTYGQHELTYTCLKSLADHPPQTPFEVLLVDDCAPEPAAAALAEIEGLRMLRNDENLGFLRSCNRGAEAMSGRYLFLLNNDTVLLPGCIDALVGTFEEHDDVGAVGAKLLYPDGRLQEAGCIVWRDGSAWNWGRGKDPAAPEYQYVREVDYCSAAALMVPAEIFAASGGFDDRYAPAYYEDTDLCLSLRDQGLRVLYQPAAQVVHFEGASHGTDETAGEKAYQARNRERFRDKWAHRLSRHLDNGVCPARERDRIDGKRVLWVEACMLTPDQDSGSLRTWRLLGILRTLGCKVTFVADNLESRQPYTSQLQQQGIEVQYAPHVSSVQALLQEHAAEYDVIVLCRHYIAKAYVDQVRRLASDALLVFDTIDLHYLRLRRQSVLDGSMKARKAAEIAYQEETSIAAQVDVTLVVSQIEAEHLRREVPAARVEVLSNVHDPVSPDQVAPPEGRSGILFVGGFQHPPNIDAVDYLAAEIWPRFRELHPDAPCYVIGSRMPDWLKQRGQAVGLEMLGYVPDLKPYYRSSRLSVSPLRYGAGVKGKVNESLGAGLPMVATPTSVEGMALQQGRDVLLAQEPAEFAAAMSRLYTDHALWATLSRHGLQRTREQFASDVAASTLHGLLDRRASAVRPLDASCPESVAHTAEA